MFTYQDAYHNQVKISRFKVAEQTDDCLVISVYQGKFLFTMHKTRGVEFPGGKSEKNETSIAAAKRELWEEAGAKLKQFYFVADYLVTGTKRTFTKRVYCGEIESLTNKLNYLETNGPLLLSGDLLKLIKQPEYSFFMRDEGMQYIAKLAIQLLQEKGVAILKER